MWQCVHLRTTCTMRRPGSPPHPSQAPHGLRKRPWRAPGLVFPCVTPPPPATFAWWAPTTAHPLHAVHQAGAQPSPAQPSPAQAVGPVCPRVSSPPPADLSRAEAKRARTLKAHATAAAFWSAPVAHPRSRPVASTARDRRPTVTTASVTHTHTHGRTLRKGVRGRVRYTDIHRRGSAHGLGGSRRHVTSQRKEGVQRRELLRCACPVLCVPWRVVSSRWRRASSAVARRRREEGG